MKQAPTATGSPPVTARTCPISPGTGALTETGIPRQRQDLSLTHPGSGFLGLEWQRTPSSNSLRGVGRDAAYLVRRLQPAGTGADAVGVR
ncbi:hypothetical protein [Nocardia jinanensis]|uniref:Uncharacterized protein n=1 Tax=Nocardia jinanensis TaxID=382504 RepID=A0A917RPH8_9NOCA|nr:hypothetical protein [Nocardia jinanensis]GGL16616.1 hypothetical protein GCM10011588_34150 [Nocardia jinanensis]